MAIRMPASPPWAPVAQAQGERDQLRFVSHFGQDHSRREHDDHDEDEHHPEQREEKNWPRRPPRADENEQGAGEEKRSGEEARPDRLQRKEDMVVGVLLALSPLMVEWNKRSAVLGRDLGVAIAVLAGTAASAPRPS